MINLIIQKLAILRLMRSKIKKKHELLVVLHKKLSKRKREKQKVKFKPKKYRNKITQGGSERSDAMKKRAHAC